MSEEFVTHTEFVAFTDSNNSRFEELENNMSNGFDSINVKLDSLTPDSIAESVNKLREVREIEAENDKDRTANNLGYLGIVAYLFVITLSVVSVIFLIYTGNSDSLPYLEKVIMGLLVGVSTLLGGVTTYFFVKNGGNKNV